MEAADWHVDLSLGKPSGGSGGGPTTLRVTYRVEGSSTADLTYQSSGGGTSQKSNVPLPWTFRFKLKQGDFYYVSAQNNAAEMYLTALDADARRTLLGILTSTPGNRAEAIGRLHARDDGGDLAELLIELEEKEWARQWFIERLSRWAGSSRSLALVAGGAFIAGAQSSSGGGTLTRGIAFFGPFSGAEFPAAGTGTFHAGSVRSVTTILLPAFSTPNAGGGQDENHVVATIQGHFPGYWVVAARITPFVSDYGKESGTLVVWLNKPAPAETPVSFSYMTFGIFND